MEFTFEVFKKTRGLFKQYLEKYSLAELNKIPEGFNNNIIWNIAHSIVTEQLLVYKLSGLQPNVSDKLINAYKKGTFPEKEITKEELEEIKELLFSTLEKTETDYKKRVFKTYNEYTLSTTGNTLTNVSQAIEFALFHEGLHFGYIMALERALKQ